MCPFWASGLAVLCLCGNRTVKQWSQKMFKAKIRVCSRSREPLYYYFQVTIFMGHRPPWLSYQLLRQQVVKREGKFKLPKWPNLDIWSTRREPNSKWPPTATMGHWDRWTYFWSKIEANCSCRRSLWIGFPFCWTDVQIGKFGHFGSLNFPSLFNTIKLDSW